MTDQDKNVSGMKNRAKDEFGRGETIPLWRGLVVPAIALAGVLFLPGLGCMARKNSDTVVVYCAQDQTYAEPILQAFEKESGIQVKAVYDSEAVKTVGLVNRLLAERNHPQCDLFWGNEEMRTRQLARMGLWRETNGFVSFGARSRCLVVNTNLVPREMMPGSLLELTNAQWRGKVAMAFPQFGTTATHLHVLRQLWGDEGWQRWCRALVTNETKVVDGNSVVVKLVGRGEAWIGLTDTDDVLAGRREGLPVSLGADVPETRLRIPNTVGFVRDAPHAENAEELGEYLQRPATLQRLVEAGAVQVAEVPPAESQTLQPDWNALFEQFALTTEELDRIFLR